METATGLVRPSLPGWRTASVTRVQTKTGPTGPVQSSQQSAENLLDLGFFEFDVLARDRVVLLLDQLVGHGARILLGNVIEAGIRRGNELDLDGDRFGHVQDLKCLGFGRRPIGLHLPRNLASDSPKSRFSRRNRCEIYAINPQRTGFSAGAAPDFPATSGLHIRAGKSRVSAVPARPYRQSRRARRVEKGTIY